jgi:hypothetical protein
MSEVVDLGCWQKGLAGDVVAVSFDLGLSVHTADTCSAKPQMNHLVQRRERPSGSGVLIVHNYERGNRVRNRKAAKGLDGDVRVMTAQVAEKQYKDARRLDPLSKIGEGLLVSQQSRKFRF